MMETEDRRMNGFVRNPFLNNMHLYLFLHTDMYLNYISIYTHTFFLKQLFRRMPKDEIP